MNEHITHCSSTGGYFDCFYLLVTTNNVENTYEIVFVEHMSSSIFNDVAYYIILGWLPF